MRRADHAREAAVGAGHEPSGRLQQPHLPVGAHDAVLHVERLAVAQQARHHVDDARPVVGVDERQEVGLGPVGLVEGKAVDAQLLARPADPIRGEVDLPAALDRKSVV